MKKRKFKDEEGRKIEETLDSGIKVTYLVEPSQQYKNEVLKPLQKEVDDAAKTKEKEQERQKRIREKLEEMAERELQGTTDAQEKN